MNIVLTTVTFYITCRQLSKLGMNVMIANNGQEAVDEWLSSEPGHYTIAIFDHVSLFNGACDSS